MFETYDILNNEARIMYCVRCGNEIDTTEKVIPNACSCGGRFCHKVPSQGFFHDGKYARLLW